MKNLFIPFLFLLSLNTQAAYYQITDLGPMDGVDTAPQGINNTRQIVGHIDNIDGYTRAFLWDNGTIKELGTLGGDYSYAFDINDSTQVVGRSSTGSDPTSQNAFLWQSGIMQNLGSLKGGGSWAQAINKHGHIVGQSDYHHAFIWINGVMEELDPLEADGHATANGINDSDQVVGWSTVNGAQHAVLWKKDGTVRHLGTLGGSLSWANDINNTDVVVGSSRDVNSNWRAFIWKNGKMKNLGTFNDGHSHGHAINDNEHVVGQADSKAFIWANGKMFDLCLIAECVSAGWDYFLDATDINNDGDVVGYGRKNGEFRGYLLTAEDDLPLPPVSPSMTWLPILLENDNQPGE